MCSGHWAATAWSFVVDVLAEKERKMQRDLPRDFSNEISVIIIQELYQLDMVVNAIL
ncbi:hypothetical protein SETIT_7G001800v2 [Setaria italica]|uniref:Uncharacterized protein n=2 Tax=Setaria TaxID=4554 RepID=A0A368RQH4_SETIT